MFCGLADSAVGVSVFGDNKCENSDLILWRWSTFWK